MYARVATWEGGDPEAIRKVAEEINTEDGPPPGVPAVGFTMLLDGKGGSIAIALFASEEDRAKGDEALNAMNPPSGENAGRRTSVEFYDVPVDVRQ